MSDKNFSLEEVKGLVQELTEDLFKRFNSEAELRDDDVGGCGTFSCGRFHCGTRFECSSSFGTDLVR